MKVRVSKCNGEVSDLQGVLLQVKGCLSAARNGQYELSIVPVVSRQTAMKRLFAVWCSHIARELGRDQKEIMRFMQTYLNGKTISLDGRTPVTIPGDDVDERLLSSLKSYAYQTFGITLPEPEDQYYETLKFQYE